MTFIELENNIRDYRRYNAVHRSRVLIVLLARDDFNEVWEWISPGLRFYENGRRRIYYLIRNDDGFSTQNIFQPSPDDLLEEWENATVVTWQQIYDG